MEKLKKLIATSYGESDNIFALHPFDVERAQKSLTEAFNIGLGFKEYIDLHEDYLVGKGVHPDHIEEQLKNVKNLQRYFSED